MCVNPARMWLFSSSLYTLDRLKVCTVGLQHGITFPYPDIWLGRCADMYLSLQQCRLSGDSNMMSLETWLYIWQRSKSRWAWLRLNGCFVCAFVCRFMCKHCGVDLCSSYYGIHKSHLLFTAVGNFYTLSCRHNRRDYSKLPYSELSEGWGCYVWIFLRLEHFHTLVLLHFEFYMFASSSFCWGKHHWTRLTSMLLKMLGKAYT